MTGKLSPHCVGTVVASVLLAGCVSMPGQNDFVTAAVSPVTERAVALMNTLQKAKLREAGIGPSEVASGRLVRVACAVMADGWWSGFALLPPGLAVNDQDVVQVLVKDPGTNAYEGVNEVVALVSPRLTSGQQAFQAIPDWRERGLRNNFERIELPQVIRDRYFVVQGSYLVRCK
jgi:hypothetical protein